MHSDDNIRKAINRWLDDVVVGLNFCPFAKKEIVSQRVRTALVKMTGTKDVLHALLEEIYLLDNDPQIATSLLVLCEGFDYFDDYLDVLSIAEQLLEQSGYRGVYQLASFHPDYVFADCDEDDAANYTNRAPYPILHVLRERQLSDVLDRYLEPERIPETNIKKARELGAQHLQTLLRACFDD
ncbi:DUF1415 domain-containing protein [Aestuariibacter salexigens]|uniref:DUF1415 domain-containing protein n=1 Tax=Aestuariibacter salexigens TaxID=226010 RepID=UPI00041B1A8E|nr:DUF1415 domain-containing protein [Aestuariibacter salexigens]